MVDAMIKIRQLKRDLKTTPLHPRYLSNLAIRRALYKFASAACGRMLDIGCGYKPYRHLFLPYVDKHIGIDIPVTIHGLEALDIAGTALALPFANDSFDTVLATEVLEHVFMPERMLGEIGRVLRPGGVLILSTPLHEPLHELPYDFFRYTHISLRSLLEQSGFSVRTIERRGGPVVVLVHLFCSFLYRRFGTTGYPDAVRIRVPMGLIILPLCSLLQLIGLILDPIVHDDFDTLGYVVLAEYV